MLLVGLTGGIGSGKSTVAEFLEAHGAVVIDADDLARDAVRAGTPGFRAVVDEFGSGVVGPDGDLDRAALAARVFADHWARGRLEAVIHPEVARRFQEALEPFRDTDRVVVYVVPLLAERHLEGVFDLVITVSVPESIRVARVMADRGMTEADVRRRMAAQATDQEREHLAHVVIRNDGLPEDLRGEVDELWADLQARVRSGSGT